MEDDPRLFTKQVLSLLSHTGISILDSRLALLDWLRHTKMVEHQGNAPGTPVWKTGVCLSTPMLEMESRAGFAPASAVLQTAACAARLTGPIFGSSFNQLARRQTKARGRGRMATP